MYAKHVAHDHIPCLKGCPLCISAQGRQRSHRRSSFPAIHSLNAGPFLEGTSFDPEVSGRDRGGKYRYFLACSYAVPRGYEVSSDDKEGLRVEPGSKPEPSAVPDDCDYSPSEAPLDRSAEDAELFPELFQVPLMKGIQVVAS